MRIIYNEGRVVGLSTYEIFVRDQLAKGTDPADIPSESEWLLLTQLVSRGGSMILVIPANTSAGYHDYTLPQGTTLVPGAPMHATLFEGEVTKISSNSVWASHITDNGRLISNTSASHPVSPGQSANVPAKADTSVSETFKQQCIDYMKIDSAIAIQPGEWVASGVAAPEMKLTPDFSKPGFVRVLLTESTTVAVPILITGFISTALISSGIVAENFGVTYKNGEFIGPGVFPWATKIEVMMTTGPLKNYLEWYVPSTLIVYYHVDTSNIIELDLADGSDAIVQAPSATKAGWTLVGWRQDTNADSNVLASLVVDRSGIHLYAVFSKVITVTLSGGDSTIQNTGIQYYNNANLSTPPQITLGSASRSGWGLLGYRTDQSAVPSVDYLPDTAYAFSADTTLYAVFSSTVTLFVTAKGTQQSYPGVCYYNSGNYTNATVTVADPTMSDANFLGYSDSATSTTVTTPSMASGITISQNTYKYAVWKYHDGTIYDGPEIAHGGYISHSDSDPAIIYDMYTFDGTKYESVVVTMTAELHPGGSHEQNPGWVDLVDQDMFATCRTYYPDHIPDDPSIPEDQQWRHPLYASTGGTQGTYESGPCENRATGTIICNCPNTNPYTLQGSLGGWIVHEEGTLWSGLGITKIVGTGRTVVY